MSFVSRAKLLKTGSVLASYVNFWSIILALSIILVRYFRCILISCVSKDTDIYNRMIVNKTEDKWTVVCDFTWVCDFNAVNLARSGQT